MAEQSGAGRASAWELFARSWAVCHCWEKGFRCEDEGCASGTLHASEKRALEILRIQLDEHNRCLNHLWSYCSNKSIIPSRDRRLADQMEGYCEQVFGLQDHTPEE